MLTPRNTVYLHLEVWARSKINTYGMRRKHVIIENISMSDWANKHLPTDIELHYSSWNSKLVNFK